jgi:CheY-like chemotaxis protein
MDTPLPILPGLVQGNGEGLLVVEDNVDAREALVDSLRSLNYHAFAAGDGVEALATLEAQGDAIALVLSDAVMPRMGGIALLRALKPAHPNARFILMTGHPLQDELASLRAQPIDMGRLSQTIAEVLNG